MKKTCENCKHKLNAPSTYSCLFINHCVRSLDFYCRDYWTKADAYMTEGKRSKGGVNKRPTTQPPSPPKGQGASERDEFGTVTMEVTCKKCHRTITVARGDDFICLDCLLENMCEG